MDKSKERLFQIAHEYSGLSEKQALSIFKKHKCPHPFDPDQWNCYMLALTGHVGCEWCGGPQKLQVSPMWGEITVCNTMMRHTTVAMVANLYQKRYPEVTREQALLAVAGKKCGHGTRFAFCDICLETERQRKFKEAT